MSAGSEERAFDWECVDPVPQPVMHVAGTIRPDPSHLSELEYRAQCFLGKWYRDLASMQPGTGRHNAVRNKARAAGGLVAAGLLTQSEAYEALFAACVANGLTQDPGGAAEKTVMDGLMYGTSTPWAPNDLPDSPTWRTRYEAPRLGNVSSSGSFQFSSPLSGGKTENYARGLLTSVVQTAEERGRLALPEIEWVAKPWVAAGCLTELDGRAKAAGKTTWMLDMVRQITRGDRFLGEQTLQGPVLLLSEQNERSLQQALRRADLLESRDLHIVLRHELGDMRWADIVGEAAEYCRKLSARLLVFDTLAPWLSLRGDAENNAADAILAIQPLQEACSRDGLGILIARHERKSGGDVGESGRGSSAYAGAVDVILALRRGGREQRETVRVLEALSRYDETPGRMVIEWQEGRYVALEDNGELAFSEVQYQIISALRERGRMRTRQFLEFVSVGYTQLTLALRALSERGLIRFEVLRSNAHEYSLPPEDEVIDV